MNNCINTSNSANPGQPARDNTSGSSRDDRDFIDRLLDFFHAPPNPRPEAPRSVSPGSSASSASDHETADNFLCAICSRRANKVLFIVCGHSACTSCTKRLWNSMRQLPGKPYNPRPVFFPCPFCRELVTRVKDDLVVDPETSECPAVDSAGGWGEGVRVVEWMLRVSRKTRERLEVEMIRRTTE
ncbi:uncharacterized protein H6S33_008752 [Morchella sextelata]|uniref:uncharacterized protein n=1 Tax=Morchella sextelata TaxID=1174677 RepID=UPI001D04D12D|nr:uncharacterized protein H6S33_008752 [Morchella sextelata]KAH0602413.1 hypothetical protein H6S33_008752 [Morchella sextelata]